MKNKIISGVMLLMAVVFSIACSNDEDYSISTSAVISSITTDDAAVTAISATTYGTIQDLSGLASSSYQVGSVYSTSADPTVGGTRQIGFIDENGKVTFTFYSDDFEKQGELTVSCVELNASYKHEERERKDDGFKGDWKE